VKFKWEEVKCRQVERSGVKFLGTRFTIIRKYTENMKFYCVFHILLVLLCITLYMAVCFVCFYSILYIMHSYFVYVLLLLCMFSSLCSVSLCCSVYICKCVLYYCHWVSTQLFTKYILSYIILFHNHISYHILYYII